MERTSLSWGAGAIISIDFFQYKYTDPHERKVGSRLLVLRGTDAEPLANV